MSTWTHHRARVAALSRSREVDDPDLVEARQDLKVAKLADHITAAIESAPPLAPAQLDRLAAILRPNAGARHAC